MKISQMVFPLMVFVSFVLFGHWTGQQIEKSVRISEQEKADIEELAAITKFDLNTFGEGSYAPVLPADTLTYSPDGEPDPIKQKNLLVIGVDDLSKSKPRLKGIWLVLYLTNMPQVTLMPVYPMVNGEDSNLLFITDERLSESFTLKADGTPHPAFLKILDQRHLWWTNFVVLDQDSVKTLLTFSKGSNQGGLSEIMHQTPPSESTSLPDPEKQPEASLLAQIQTIQNVCHTSNLDLSIQQVAGLISDLRDHMTTDITAEQVVQDLKSMLLYGGGFICEFPSLSKASQTN